MRPARASEPRQVDVWIAGRDEPDLEAATQARTFSGATSITASPSALEAAAAPRADRGRRGIGGALLERSVRGLTAPRHGSARRGRARESQPPVAGQRPRARERDGAGRAPVRGARAGRRGARAGRSTGGRTRARPAGRGRGRAVAPRDAGEHRARARAGRARSDRLEPLPRRGAARPAAQHAALPHGTLRAPPPAAVAHASGARVDRGAHRRARARRRRPAAHHLAARRSGRRARRLRRRPPGGGPGPRSRRGPCAGGGPRRTGRRRHGAGPRPGRRQAPRLRRPRPARDADPAGRGVRARGDRGCAPARGPGGPRGSERRGARAPQGCRRVRARRGHRRARGNRRDARAWPGGRRGERAGGRRVSPRSPPPHRRAPSWSARAPRARSSDASSWPRLAKSPAAGARIGWRGPSSRASASAGAHPVRGPARGARLAPRAPGRCAGRPGPGRRDLRRGGHGQEPAGRRAAPGALRAAHPMRRGPVRLLREHHPLSAGARRRATALPGHRGGCAGRDRRGRPGCARRGGRGCRGRGSVRAGPARRARARGRHEPRDDARPHVRRPAHARAAGCRAGRASRGDRGRPLDRRDVGRLLARAGRGSPARARPAAAHVPDGVPAALARALVRCAAEPAAAVARGEPRGRPRHVAGAAGGG